ncbi:MAG: ABC transporter permease, partial [Thermomicrobia bacterium]|nr:ABC transporter permease [Thermomicrobia bacterium]
AIVAAILTGFLYGLIPGYLKAYFGANEIVSTLMLNAIATAVYAFILVQFLKPPRAGNNESRPFAIFGATNRLRPLIADTQISVIAIIAIAATIFTHILLYRTTFGYGLRMSGYNLRFAEYGGVNTRRTVMLAMAISGGIAGIAGAGLVLGTFGRINAAPSAGYGFDGIVVALLARNFPLAVIPAALFYSYLRVGADVMGQNTDVPFEMANVIQAIIILLISAETLTRWLRRRRSQRDEPELPPMSAPETITSTATVPTDAAG